MFVRADDTDTEIILRMIIADRQQEKTGPLPTHGQLLNRTLTPPAAAE